MNQPSVFSAGDLRIGLQADFEREITAVDITNFAALSEDWNPLHMDSTYAASTNYGGRIVHGALQVALASAMAGMHLPGREVVVGSFQCRFPAPLPYPCKVRVSGEITAWIPQSVSGSLRVRVVDLSSGILTAEIHVGFSLHEQRTTKPETLLPLTALHSPSVDSTDTRPIVVLTGGSGGLGTHIVATLSKSYRVVGVSRSIPPASDAQEWVAADLTSPDWEQAIERHLNGRKIFGFVHTAWPAGPSGGLLDVENDALRTQTEFGTVITVRAARLLRAHAEGSARFVILGSTAATVKPVLNMAAYSLGKAALEHTVRLLAPELGRSGITINLVTPSFVPIGMNQSKTSRAVLLETAKVPLGKLCAPEDVAAAIEFFLSPGAAFISGQMLPLTGAQL